MQSLIPSASEFLRAKQPYAYWLDHIPGIGNKTIHHLLEEFEYPDMIYQAKDSELLNLLNKKQLHNLRLSQQEFDLMGEYQKLCEKRISFLPCYHPAFPAKLKNIPDPPYCIYFYGKLPPSSMPLVAIIGARNCSEYGKRIAKEFASSLASAGIGVVSGLARGIDGYAGQAALDAGGKTYAFLGSSVDICYPQENLPLYNAIPKNGALISEYPPQTPPKQNLFPQRNRLISGLSDAVIVIEAREKSGTLITVDMALEQGREVYAIPGRITDALSNGCNKLIRQGANIALSPQDIVSDLCIEAFHCEEHESTQKSTALLTEKEQCILHILDYDPVSIDRIYQFLSANPLFHNLTLQELLHTMTCLTLKGLVVTNGGAYSLKI